MAGIFDFIKKKNQNATDPQTDTSSQSSAQPVVVSETVEEPEHYAKSYNGIGAPPSGQSYNGIGSPPSGVSYNGIGSTPSGADPYNGIGRPPQTQVSTPQASSPSSQGSLKTQTVQQNPAMRKETTDEVKPTGIKTTDNTRVQADVKDLEVKDKTNEKTVTQPKTSQNEPQSGSVSPAMKSTIDDKKRATLDVMTHLTHRSNVVFVQANKKALELRNEFVDSEHLLAGLLTDGEIFKIFVDLKIQPQIIEQELIKSYKKESHKEKPQLSPRVKQITENALVIARKLGYEFISPEHLLLALFDEGEGVGARVLTKLGLQKKDLYKRVTGKAEGVLAVSPEEEKKQQHKSESALMKYTIDLTKKAENNELDPVVERSDVIERVVHILSRRIKNNPALIGEPGVGKTAIIEGLAQRIVSQSVPEGLLHKRILQIDLAGILAGASHRGEFEERMKQVVDELKENNDKYIMFIDEMHTMMGAGSGEGALDASNFIKPALARGEIQFIGATTITEYRKYIEKDAALERRFQVVMVNEPSVESAIKMMKASRDKYEAFHKVKIPDDTIEFAVKLSKRYIGDRFLPDKGFDLMDEAAAAVRLPLISLPEEIKSTQGRLQQIQQEIHEFESKNDTVRARIARSKLQEVQDQLKAKNDEYALKKAQTTTEVTKEVIKDIIAKRTGIPVSKISTSEGDKLVKLEDIIHKRMINQDRAVASVAQAIRRGRAGLKSTKRPIGSFVFLGPTGVGKTELAKTVSEVLFDDEEAVIRFDMTEYMERHEVAKLLGPPPGYVGFEEGGKLTEAVRRKPYSLVLFDEIEKAHPDIFNILLQILDDGRLTDNKGRTISFKNSVVICTSNIGTKMIQDEMVKSGGGEVAEPPVLSTYTFTPRGRELLTIGNKYFERDEMKTPTPTTSPSGSTQQQAQVQTGSGWNDHTIAEYFAGQKTDTQEPQTVKSPLTQEDAQKEELKKQVTPSVFPMFGYDTHAISPNGEEVITKGSTIFSRNATTSKVWKVSNLIDAFTDHVVINALPDSPDEQLPTIRLKTHAYSPNEQEIITFKNRYWMRKPGAKDWKTGLLKEYFGEGKQTQDLPVSYWDIHTFSPSGKEIIIVGNFVWSRENAKDTWTKLPLSAYFGSDFPLDKVLQEKEEKEVHTSVKRYDQIKDKVMGELLKFFRPELVNRFDEVIIFEPLKYAHMIEIVKLQLKGVSKLLEEQEIGFSATDGAIKTIVREGFDPIYGARPLRRSIQKLVENPISELIIGEKVKAGDIIEVDYNGEELVFNIIQSKAVSSEMGKKPLPEHILAYCQTKGATLPRELKNATPLCQRYWKEQEELANAKKSVNKQADHTEQESNKNNTQQPEMTKKRDDLEIKTVQPKEPSQPITLVSPRDQVGAGVQPQVVN